MILTVGKYAPRVPFDGKRTRVVYDDREDAKFDGESQAEIVVVDEPCMLALRKLDFGDLGAEIVMVGDSFATAMG